MQVHQHRFVKVFWPLLIEIFLTVLVSLSDTLMLYGVGQTAVAAVGSSITYLNFLNVSFLILSAGLLAVFTQYVGANQAEVTKKAAWMGVIVNSIIALFVMGLIYLFFSQFIHFIIPDQTIADLATQYGLIVGIASIFIAINPIIGNYMRAFGHDKSPMVATIIANIINITLNYLAIFVFDWGVAGVAWATVIAHAGSFVAHVVLAVAVYVQGTKWRAEHRETDRIIWQSLHKLNAISVVDVPILAARFVNGLHAANLRNGEY